MADDSVEIEATTETKDWAKRFRVAGLETWGSLLIVIGLTIVIGSSVFFWEDYKTRTLLTENISGPINLLVLAAGAVIAQLGRMQMLWQKIKPAYVISAFRSASAEDRLSAQLTINRGFVELFLYLICTLVLTSAVLFASRSGSLDWLLAINLNSKEHSLTLYAVLLMSFVPVGVGLSLQSLREAERLSEENNSTLQVFRDDVISGKSLFTFIIVSASIGCLAWLAGLYYEASSKNPDTPQNFFENNFGIFATAVIVAGFVLFVLMPHIISALRSRDEQASADFYRASGLANIYPSVIVSRLDSFVVHFIAPISGATQRGRGIPHLLVVSIMLPLTILGYLLPPPWGLAPISLALLIAVSLGRRWSWIEEDRETASRLETTQGSSIFVGFRNNLRDEALLAYIFLFVLVPLGLRQLNIVTSAFDGGSSFFDWLRFFGAELAKAVPFVDWAEIYEFSPTTDIKMESTYARHLVFGSRVLVDFVIMAALFQALSIWQRSRTQKKLYAAGQLDAFDPFTERSFFEDGIRPSSALEKNAFEEKNPNKISPFIQTPTGEIFKARTQFMDSVELHLNNSKTFNKELIVPYSRRRLSELIRDENKDAQAGAMWMARAYSLLVGVPEQQMDQLIERWQTPLTTPDLNISAERKDARLTLEILFKEASDPDRGIGRVTLEDVRRITTLLDFVKAWPEFVNVRQVAFDLLGQTVSTYTVLGLSAHLIDPSCSGHVDDPTLNKWLNRLDNFPELYVGRAENRRPVYEKLGHMLDTAQDQNSAGYRAIIDILGRLSLLDQAQSGQAHAAAALMLERPS